MNALEIDVLRAVAGGIIGDEGRAPENGWHGSAADGSGADYHAPAPAMTVGTGVVSERAALVPCAA